MELSISLSEAAAEALKRRHELTGRTLAEEAQALIEAREGPDHDVWSQLEGLLHRWVRIEQNEIYVDGTWLLRANRDGMPDAHEFRKLVAQLGKTKGDRCLPRPIALERALDWQERLRGRELGRTHA